MLAIAVIVHVLFQSVSTYVSLWGIFYVRFISLLIFWLDKMLFSNSKWMIEDEIKWMKYMVVGRLKVVDDDIFFIRKSILYLTGVI